MLATPITLCKPFSPCREASGGLKVLRPESLAALRLRRFFARNRHGPNERKKNETHRAGDQ